MFVIHNTTLVLRDEVITDGWIATAGAQIVALGDGPAPAAEHRWDAGGSLCLPGLVDLHSDFIEKMIQPRPGVELDVVVALHATDRLLLSAGVTTQYHALSLDDAEFGVRNERFIHTFIEHLARDAALGARHRIHARVEVSSEQGVHAFAQLAGHPAIGLVSVMDHSPGQGQYTTEESFRRYVARSTGRSDAEIDAIMARKRELQAHAAAHEARVLTLARATGVPCASHDDDTAGRVARRVADGVAISEFPTTLEAALAAHRAGMSVGMGAPNIMRGISSGGNLRAIEAWRAGALDWLCADYYPPALLSAVFHLVEHGDATLPAAVALVSANPARAAGCADVLGSLAPGMQADIVLVERLPHAVVRAVFVAGRCVLHAPCH
ncbi:MAG: alpha-D-ribose 1-methylphosphonate 5-triphosphate diphosphatase [Chloroflexi bacterium]|nr:alpha-D-ribose 1-methylphosphonate 5-triphosphate diphosphatase [Chloroflexota bacterium]